jgi:hypothetical protein
MGSTPENFSQQGDSGDSLNPFFRFCTVYELSSAAAQVHHIYNGIRAVVERALA